jgi:hypothetical protein
MVKFKLYTQIPKPDTKQFVVVVVLAVLVIKPRTLCMLGKRVLPLSIPSAHGYLRQSLCPREEEPTAGG